MSTAVPIPSIFDTYNAKWLTPIEVAQSFIAPPQFGQLVKRSNSLIVGPRGSGKTTLLKMLTEPAREAWQGGTASRYIDRIDYTGVFIATDVTWKSQVNGLGDERVIPEARHLVQMAALTAHAQKSLVETMEHRATGLRQPSRRTGIASESVTEASLVVELADLWKLTPRVPSFFSLRSALRGRLQHIYEVAAMVAELRSEEQMTRLNQEPYVRLPLIVSCRNGIEQFNDSFDDAGRYWALLFDEVELMPSAVRRELFECLRTLPDRVLFKLALSPFDEEIPELGSGQRDHDFDFIPLWFARKRRAYKFCTGLWRGMVRGTILEGKTPQEVLGRSLLDTESTEWGERGTAYANGSSHHKYIRELCEHDQTFRAYLRTHNIDPANIQAVRGSRRASTLRKVFPLVVARAEYAKAGADGSNGDSTSQLRSRKLSMIYSGAASLFDVCEGNPRVFKGLVSRLLERIADQQRTIDPATQADEITQAISRFRALLRTIVVSGTRREQFPRGLLSLLDPIARRFQREALTAAFSPEPPASIIVDSAVSEDEARMIGYAMNAGALVYVPDREGEEELLSMSRVRGKRFRLSYLYAAQFGIVPRLGRGVSLRELRGSDTGKGLFAEEASS